MPPKRRKPSALFRYIETVQGDRPWGSVLDAGAGANSTGWIASLQTDQWTAVTGSPGERDWTETSVKDRKRTQDRILLGNWGDAALLRGETFDTVIADYLLGAVEGFAPYLQTYLFERLRPHIRGPLYITGLEPYVPAPRSEDVATRTVWDIGRFRDSCMLLSGRMPYREYPAIWVVDQLKQAGFRIESVKHFNRRFGARFVNAQIDLCAPGLSELADRDLAARLIHHGEALREKALDLISNDGPLRTGRDYVISARLTADG